MDQTLPFGMWRNIGFGRKLSGVEVGVAVSSQRLLGARWDMGAGHGSGGVAHAALNRFVVFWEHGEYLECHGVSGGADGIGHAVVDTPVRKCPSVCGEWRV